jgi:hypothetical protein
MIKICLLCGDEFEHHFYNLCKDCCNTDCTDDVAQTIRIHLNKIKLAIRR